MCAWLLVKVFVHAHSQCEPVCAHCVCVCVCEREPVGDAPSVCAHARLVFALKYAFLRKHARSTERRCACARLCVYICRGYCGALVWSRVNSSLTPIHYGPLPLLSRSSALRHSQPTLFHTQCKSLEPSAQTQRGTSASLPPGEKYYLHVFFLNASVNVRMWGCCWKFWASKQQPTSDTSAL